MTIEDLRNALAFLSKTFVGRGDEDRFLRTIESIKKEIKKREGKK